MYKKKMYLINLNRENAEIYDKNKDIFRYQNGLKTLEKERLLVKVHVDYQKKMRLLESVE